MGSVRGDLADIAARRAGRSSESEVTLFKSVGLAFEDLSWRVLWHIAPGCLRSNEPLSLKMVPRLVLDPHHRIANRCLPEK